jgi:hypothetical protein
MGHLHVLLPRCFHPSSPLSGLLKQPHCFLIPPNKLFHSKRDCACFPFSTPFELPCLVCDSKSSRVRILKLIIFGSLAAVHWDLFGNTRTFSDGLGSFSQCALDVHCFQGLGTLTTISSSIYLFSNFRSRRLFTHVYNPVSSILTHNVHW